MATQESKIKIGKAFWVHDASFNLAIQHANYRYSSPTVISNWMLHRRHTREFKQHRLRQWEMMKTA